MATATKTRSKVKTPNEKLMEMSETRSNIASYTIKGTTPYLQHCDLLANPMHPMQEVYKTLTGKKKKTREDHLNIGRVQFESAIYYGEKGPYVPSTHIHAALRNAARKVRQGKIVEESVNIRTDNSDGIAGFYLSDPISGHGIDKQYPSPQEMWEEYVNGNEEFVNVTMVGQKGKGKTPCWRPIFQNWTLQFGLQYFANSISPSEVDQYVKIAGQKCSIGSYRPLYGRFEIVTSNHAKMEI